jgi:hypothetical protein
VARIDDDLAGLLDLLDFLLARYVAYPSDEARWAVVGWVMHCWALAAFESTPRLAVLSPEKGSGKTRTLEVLELVVPGALRTASISSNALFRLIDKGDHTVLMDEADTIFGPKAQQHEELRALLNSGHRRGSPVYRCEVTGKKIDTVAYNAFAPAAIAGIGDLPDTVLDRSILIPMRRRAADETVTAFRQRRAERDTDGLREWLDAWSSDARNIEPMRDKEPEMPPGIVDRAADVWEPLVIIGDRAGEDWSDRLRGAAVKLNNDRAQRDVSLGVKLLRDCRTVFGDRDRLTTEELLEGLNALEESPWGDLKGKPLNARRLSWRVGNYDIGPKPINFGDFKKRGYLAEDFHDAWKRYL